MNRLPLCKSRIDAYPAPLARAYVRLLNSPQVFQQADALADLSHAVVALLHALALKVLPPTDTVLVPPLLTPPYHSWPFSPALKSLWAKAAKVLGPANLPDLAETSDFAFLSDYFPVQPPGHLFAALQVLSSCRSFFKPPPEAQTEPRPDPSFARLCDLTTQLLFDKHLSFLRSWTLVYCQALPHPEVETRLDLLNLTGHYPLPQQLQPGRPPGPLTPRQVYFISPDGCWINLHPFCLWFDPPAPGMTSETAELSPYSTDLLPGTGSSRFFLLHQYTSEEVFFQDYGDNVRIARNDLNAAIQKIFAPRRPRSSPTRRNVSWGFLSLELENTVQLNLSLGYEVVDAVLAAIDRAAAELASHNSGNLDEVRLFPFWYRPDLVVIPLAFDEKFLGSPDLAAALEDLLQSLALAGAQVAPPGKYLPLNMVLNLCLFVRKDHVPPRTDILFLQALEYSRSLVRQLRSQSAETAATSNLWLKQETPRQGFFHRLEKPYSRLSKAAFAVIPRQQHDTLEFLLIWNNRHQVFNFVGGHFEPEDLGDPVITLQREVQEELGLAAGSYTARPLFTDAVYSVEYSQPFQAFTFYRHFFFLIDCLPPLPLRPVNPQPSGSQETVWASLSEIQDGRLTDGRTISRFPYRLLQELLPQMFAVNLPLAAADYSDLRWLPVNYALGE